MPGPEPSLTCRRASDLLADYLEQTLPPEQMRAMRAHLSGCMPCERFVDSYRRTSDVCRRALNRAVPAELSERVLSFLRSQTGKKPL